MRSTNDRDRGSTRHDRTDRPVVVRGTRGQRSYPTRPLPEHAHRLPRQQPPPIA